MPWARQNIFNTLALIPLGLIWVSRRPENQQQKLAGDVAHEPDDQDSTSPDAIPHDSPHGGANQHAGSVTPLRKPT